MVCSKCGTQKPDTDFPKKGRRCRACVNAYNLNRYYTKGGRERLHAERRAKSWARKAVRQSAVSETDRAYAAGIVDGEGCIRINIRRAPLQRGVGQLTLIVHVTNTKRALVEWLMERWPQGTISSKQPDHEHNRQGSFVWSVVANRALAFLDDIYPFLLIKREQAKAARRYQRYVQRGGRHRTEKLLALQMQFAEHIRRLNRRGVGGWDTSTPQRPEWRERPPVPPWGAAQQ